LHIRIIKTKKSFPATGRISRTKDSLFYRLKQAVPPRPTFPTKPNERRLANNMGFRNKSPKSAILASMTVISHHPVIVPLAFVGIGRLAVNKKFAVSLFQSILFIIGDKSTVNVNVCGS
jgi:hypothetical protein